MRAVVEQALADGKPADHLVDAIMVLLSDLGLAHYAPKGTVPLLSSQGRVLVCLLERPTVTLREMALYLGSSETQVSRTLQQLVQSKLITRTKVGIRNHYELNKVTALAHPDLARFLRVSLEALTRPMTDISPTTP